MAGEITAMIEELEDHFEEMSSWEQDFIASVVDRSVEKLSDKQRAKIVELWERYCV